jgi:two-component system, cell cycle sensor histidine kinase and response regulator CckA
MAVERLGLRVLVVAQPARAATLAASLTAAAPGRLIVATASPANEPDREAHDLFLVDAADAGKDLARLREKAPALVVLSDGEVDPAEAASRGAKLVLPRGVPPDVLASALLSAAAWSREDAALREEREHLLDRLVASERTASMGTLSAGIAHEINNPLASVVANLALLGEQLSEAVKKPALMSELKDAVAEAQRGADRVAQIVRGLKVFSRGDDERRRALDLAPIADSALRLVANEIRHRARVVRDFKPAPLVEASETHLVQVFVNLVLNAAQSIPEGDAENNEVRVSVRPGGSGQVIAEVADTGAGMSAEVLGRVFDPFFTTRRVGDGVGLGLSICHGIVTSLGGHIEAKSEPGKGSLFRLTLPAARATAPVDKPAGSVPHKRARILLVEDDPLVARAVQRILGDEHEVTSVTGGRAALHALAADAYDAILCDLMMPEMSGMELHAELSRTSPELIDRMAFLSGGAFTEAAREFLARVPNPQIEKPFDPKTLREAVRRLLRR